MKRYVALGSSMAAGPGIRPRVRGTPRRAGRSSRNYAHLVAERTGLHLSSEFVDVTYSGATTAHVLTDRQNGAPPQIEALDGSETLVTVTIGGNDVGYVPLLMAASLPKFARHLLAGFIDDLLDRDARDEALSQVFGSLCAVGGAIRERARGARVFFVDYLTLPPPRGAPAPPYSNEHADLGRHVAAELELLTAKAAAATDCEVVHAAAASRDHHAWSKQPWTTPPGLPLPGRPAPLHPNADGMIAVTELIVAQL